MRYLEFPSYLVTYEIAKSLNEIGYREFNLFYVYSDEYLEDLQEPEDYNYLMLRVRNRVHSDTEISIDQLRESKSWSDETLTIPTWTEVFKWFRDKGYLTEITYDFKYRIFNESELVTESEPFCTYEGAQIALVKNLINVYKNEKSN